MVDPMTDRSSLRQSWPLWCAGFLAFPVAGLVLGGAQSLVSRGRFVIFGAYGAIVFSALSGLLLHHLVPYRR
jgi:hypothetical protein